MGNRSRYWISVILFLSDSGYPWEKELARSFRVPAGNVLCTLWKKVLHKLRGSQKMRIKTFFLDHDLELSLLQGWGSIFLSFLGGGGVFFRLENKNICCWPEQMCRECLVLRGITEVWLVKCQCGWTWDDWKEECHEFFTKINLPQTP